MILLVLFLTFLLLLLNSVLEFNFSSPTSHVTLDLTDYLVRALIKDPDSAISSLRFFIWCICHLVCHVGFNFAFALLVIEIAFYQLVSLALRLSQLFAGLLAIKFH